MEAEGQIVRAKIEGPYRSSRRIRDLLGLPVHEETVRQILIKHHLERTSLPPIKPIGRFEAQEPNDLWQIDIQGKVHFPLIGDLLLILVTDDHSRFLLSGRWGLPQAILSDKGNQFQAHQVHGEAEYQYLLRRLNIEPIFARKPRTKGKVERQFRFIQRDFALENLHHVALEALNSAWAKWMEWYNWQHRHKGLDQECPADRYVQSLRKPTSEDLELLLIHEEPRKVMRTGCISYYGQTYRVADRYIGRRVWTILKGDTLRIECNRELIAEYRIKTDYLEALSRDS